MTVACAKTDKDVRAASFGIYCWYVLASETALLTFNSSDNELELSIAEFVHVFNRWGRFPRDTLLGAFKLCFDSFTWYNWIILLHFH